MISTCYFLLKLLFFDPFIIVQFHYQIFNPDEEVDTRIDTLTDQLDELKSCMENVHEKMYDYETSKKNNLIFYGIPKEERETAKTLILKIKSIIQNRLNIRRYISISGACRLFTGQSFYSQYKNHI